MDLKDISALRLANQQITGTRFKTGKEIVSWMGAMQAQDFPMAKWAIGSRLPDATDKTIETAFNNGEIVRTHLLRPTWHFVAAEDILWMLQLTAPQIKASLKARQKQLGLTDAILSKSIKIIEKSLANGNHLTRRELMTELEKAKIPTHEYRSGHLMLHAELEALVCSGPVKGKDLTYALLEERVTKKPGFTKEEALATLAQRYFSSHSPATLQDFLWWSGLYVADARKALESVKSMFISEKIGEQTYWFDPSFSIPKLEEELIFLLPAFDEYLISYKDRSSALTFTNHNKAVSNNGIFRPIIVEKGNVTGIWKRAVKKGNMMLETTFFEKFPKDRMAFVEKAVVAFGDFVERKTVLSFS